MRQKIVLLFFTVCFFTTSVPCIPDGFQIIDKKNQKLTLNLRIAFSGDYDIEENKAGVSVNSARMALCGELYKWLGFKASFDTVAPNTGNDDYIITIRDLYIQTLFADYIEFQVGQFKVPFGEEIFYSLGERPYIGRSHTTDNIPPGRDIGIMASGRKIAGLFGYNMGIFLGAGQDLPSEAQGTYLVAGKIFTQYNPGFLDIKAGYNAYYHYYHQDVSNHQLAQGFFGKVNVSFGKNNVLSLLTEYQERLLTRSVINQNMDWRRGIFGVISCRFGVVEPLLLAEWYDDSLLYTDENGLFSLKTGLAGYFLKQDILRIKLLYELDYPGDSGVISHKVSTLVQLEF